MSTPAFKPSQVAMLSRSVLPFIDTFRHARDLPELLQAEGARRVRAAAPSWLVPWDQLSEADKEVDRRIGLRLANIGRSR